MYFRLPPGREASEDGAGAGTARNSSTAFAPSSPNGDIWCCAERAAPVHAAVALRAVYRTGVAGLQLRRRRGRQAGGRGVKVFGIPFKIVPLKENPPTNGLKPPAKTWHIRAVPERAQLEIRFPRVEGYAQGIRHRVKVDWESIASLTLDPMDIPPEVEMKAGLPSRSPFTGWSGPP